MSASVLEVVPVPVAGQRRYHGESFPYALENSSADATLDDTVQWLAAHRDSLGRQVEQCGAIFFRGLPVNTAQDFDRFVAAFGWENFPYEESLSNAVRVNKTPRVFTANEAPPSVTIFLHHEMAQTPIYPTKLFFFCEQPAEQGGATPICRSDVLWERIESLYPAFAVDCVNKGLRYSNVMPSENDAASGMGRSWQSTLRAATREEAERRLKTLGYSWQWLDDGCLRAATPVLQAVHNLPSGRRSFFNQLIAAYRGWKDTRNDPSKSITFGDGTPLDTTAASAAVEMAEDLTFDIPWKKGDVALVDNMIAMHGRRTFSGTRKVLASLVGAQNSESTKALPIE